MKKRRARSAPTPQRPALDTSALLAAHDGTEANVWLCICTRKKDGSKQLRANDRSIVRCEHCGVYRCQADRSIRDMADADAGKGRIAVLGQPKMDDGWANGPVVIVAVPATPEREVGLWADEAAMYSEERRRRGARVSR